MLIVGLILLLIIGICIKLFDDRIRPNHWLKVIVNTATISGLFMVIIGFIQFLIS